MLTTNPFQLIHASGYNMQLIYFLMKLNVTMSMNIPVHLYL